MQRTMNARTLNDYLISAHTAVMLCRAHADNFSLSPADIADAQLRIELHIADLETLCSDIQEKNVISPKAKNVIQIAPAREAELNQS
ncbi:hypothetical protein GIY56_12580 [Paracoccus sp. YIM 132242]|uniref:Uncharacterized protein n=1 Tax=Paracoccus lichenicola TaxID=2665644 RepID=A0A6L6HRQ7_9RHOB|nr:hypothetical protein [Paracoccus lichenicola]MTE01129.1 hypothetical protein [Paracoccus lichenicola]